MADMSAPETLAPDLLEKVAAACVTCWREAHPPPPASALVLMDDYRWKVQHEFRHQQFVAALAWEDGYEGTLNDLQHAAHREMYARSGSEADLIKMLRHVTPDDQSPAEGKS